MMIVFSVDAVSVYWEFFRKSDTGKSDDGDFSGNKGDLENTDGSDILENFIDGEASPDSDDLMTSDD